MAHEDDGDVEMGVDWVDNAGLNADFVQDEFSGSSSGSDDSEDDGDLLDDADEPRMQLTALDLKGEEKKHLYDARHSILDNDEFLQVVTASELPAGASFVTKGAQKLIAFAAPTAKTMEFDIPRERFAKLFVVTDGKTSFSADATQELARYLLEQPSFPQQIALSGLKSRVNDTIRVGQKWIAFKRFACAASRDGCPTLLQAGFLVASPQVCFVNQISVAARNRFVIHAQKLSVVFDDVKAACVHVFGEQYGQVKGVIRRELVQQDPRAYQLQLKSLGSLRADRFFSGNRLGVPGRHAAEKMSTAASHFGWLHQKLPESLLSMQTYYIDKDQAQAADQKMRSNSKRALWGFAFYATSSPVNIILASEASLRIYLALARAEPGFYCDYTGGICKPVCERASRFDCAKRCAWRDNCSGDGPSILQGRGEERGEGVALHHGHAVPGRWSANHRF